MPTLKSKNTKIYFGITIITLCVILFVVLAIFVKLSKVNALNDWFYNTFAKPIQNNALTNFIIVFTYLGNFFVLLIISLCFLFKKQKNKLWNRQLKPAKNPFNSFNNIYRQMGKNSTKTTQIRGKRNYFKRKNFFTVSLPYFLYRIFTVCPWHNLLFLV